MAEYQELQSMASMISDEAERLGNEAVREWMEEHLPELKQQYISGQHLLYQSLAVSSVVGLAAHVGGYLLLSSGPSGLLGLLADLLHALGWSLWTGAVVALFLQIYPEAKRRQIKQAVDAYEASRREKAKAAGDRDRTALERPDGRRAGRKQGKSLHRNSARKAGKSN